MSPGELAGNAVTQQSRQRGRQGPNGVRGPRPAGRSDAGPGAGRGASLEAETRRREEKRMSVVTERAEGGRALSPPSSAAVQQRAASRLAQRSPHEPPDCRRVVVGGDGSPGSAAEFQRAASQARQRNAMLDV